MDSQVPPPPPSSLRLEFVGDVVLGLAAGKHLYPEHPSLSPGQLTNLRSANVSNDKLARVGVRHGLHRYVRHNNNLDDSLLHEIEEFANEVSEEDDIILYGSIKAPKILADIVESLAAAIYFDLNFDLQKLWVIFRDLLEPITTLHEQCQKQGRKVDIKPGREGAKNIAPVYVDGVSIASCSSDQSMDIAVLNAAKQALLKIEKEEGLNQYKKYVCSAQVPIDGGLSIEGEENMQVREFKSWDGKRKCSPIRTHAIKKCKIIDIE
ncbi:ribonuclease 3-like protein 2 [Quercus suber]|uniref:Ribonuclease 3-like protein 2 n=1 Tax=Quercus suber TaxID=58331 RepID=A0AAW0LT95_QUESU